MTLHRTPQDVYSLVLPNSPLDGNYKPGDSVKVQQHRRVERLAAHGWIAENYEQDTGELFDATLTYLGSVILNFWAENPDAMSVLDEGCGVYVERALEYAAENRQIERWEIQEMEDGKMKLVGHSEDGFIVTREYELIEQEHVAPAV